MCGLEIEQLWCCVVGIINYKVEYLAAILGFIVFLLSKKDREPMDG